MKTMTKEEMANLLVRIGSGEAIKLIVEKMAEFQNQSSKTPYQDGIEIICRKVPTNDGKVHLHPCVILKEPLLAPEDDFDVNMFIVATMDNNISGFMLGISSIKTINISQCQFNEISALLADFLLNISNMLEGAGVKPTYGSIAGVLTAMATASGGNNLGCIGNAFCDGDIVETKYSQY